MFKEKRTKCPLCEASNIKKHCEIKTYIEHFSTDRCMNCGFIFMNPVFDDETLASFYSREYYGGQADYSYIDERELGHYADYVYNARIRNIRKFVPGGNFLDVGCSFGGLLKCAERFFSPHGIEISPYSHGHVSKLFPGKIHNGTLEDHNFSENFFSVITMVEVIEHLEDPGFAIDECFKLLRDRGILLIQTANMDGRQAKKEGSNYAYYMPGHLSYFSMSNLSDRLKAAGFSKIKTFRPVDFGLLPKLLKSRGNFTKFSDYLAWYRISKYHMLSKIYWGNFSMTSSMVVYAIK